MISNRESRISGQAGRLRARGAVAEVSSIRDEGNGRALCLVVALVLVLIVVPLRGAVTGVGPIGLVVDDLEREIAFYTTVLSFEQVGGIVHHSGAAAAQRYGMSDARTRTVALRLGAEEITLTSFESPKGGQPIPADSRSYDHWFQHIAIVVSDMDRAYAHLAAHKVRHVSTAPQTLPGWNVNAGGIRAFYFQDPERHVLEIIWFPPGKGDPRWQVPATQLFLGIDHTAIVVSDSERSLAYYRDTLGLTVAGGAENYGVEQEHLNQVFGARLRITALRAPHGPGVEFLEYIAPPGGRPLPADAQVNDRLAWTIGLRVDGRAEHVPGTIVSPELRRDPDGHLLLLLAP